MAFYLNKTKIFLDTKNVTLVFVNKKKAAEYNNCQVLLHEMHAKEKVCQGPGLLLGVNLFCFTSATCTYCLHLTTDCFAKYIIFHSWAQSWYVEDNLKKTANEYIFTGRKLKKNL